MKQKVLSCVAAMALMFTLAAPAFSQTTTAPPAGRKGTMAMGQHGNERHPMIRRAIRALEKAKYDLQHAAHDFGGHRDEAIEACDNAIKQLQLALQYDKK
jgi:hypothetical protein